ncbi:MAG TPA: contractile injection system tape measure protein [Gallionella sp.]|nr:contractile injection system tape measure protein [Gallionella sp.]
MDKHHIIDDVEFDISFDSMGSAREHEAGLPDFIRERLLPVADEIFCELADGDTVVRIDRLELDLGDIRHGEFRDEMESRFGEKLRALLREKMQSFATTHSPLEGMIGRPQAEQGQLEVFLETGRMPWHDQRATGDTVDALLEQTLARQGGEFAEFMKRTPHRDVVVKRLSMQFSDRLLTDVMRLFAPAHAVLLGELTGKLGDMWKDMPASITAKELKAQVWERLIGEHLKTGVPDPEWLLREISKDLFVRHARSSLPQASEGANESLREFHVKDASVENGESAGNLPGHARGSGEVVDKTGNEGRADVSLAASAASAASAAKQSDASSERRSNIARQRAQLETAFATGDADELAGQWDALRNDYRELVREVFMQRMGDGKLLEKLAEGFPESMLHDLLNILSQQDGGFMAELSDLPELRGAKNEKSSVFWIYTLGFLHGAQDSDRAEYARGLIRSLSAQGMEQAPLLQALIALAPELQAALADMQAEHATDSRPPAEEPARAEELYRRVTQRLNGTSGEPEFAALLEEMANACPETLARLQRQVQSGELHADVGTLDAREAGQMVAALIRLNSGVKESDFLRAVETQAQQARDRQRYYCHILERLIRNETVDLEAALGVSGNETAQQDVRAASVGDAAPGQQPSAQPGRQSKGQERITRPLAEFAGTGRAAELYRRVTRHLSGVSDGEPEFAAMVEEMASVYPESLAYVQRQLQSGELRADIGRLDAVEARQLVVSLIRLNSGAKESDFLRAIGRYAGRAKSERGYYQRVLENMICNRTIDLVDAVRSQGEIVSRDLQRTAPDADGMVAAGSSSRQEDRATVDAEPALEPVKLLRIRLEEALVLGRAEGVEAVWGELLQSHVAMLREVFVQRLDSEVARSRLVDEFPEPMLYGLIRALAPADGGFVEMLAGQPELRSSGMAGAKNIPLLEYTLSYLHACGASGYDRFEYARGLVRSLAEQGFARTDTLRAIVRIDPELEAAMIASGGTMTAFGGEVVPASESCGEGAADSVSQGLLAGTLIRKLLQRLCDRDRTLAREIGELAEAWPEVAREFYRQLQLDAVALDVAVLSAREASLHAAAFIVSNHGRMGDDFLREIELHAGKAQDELYYHRTILEMLLHNKVVDLEVAMIAAPGSAIWEEGSLVHSRMDDAPGIGALRTRFESALMEGDAEAITDVWDELRFNRGALVREVFNLRMGEGASRKKLAERFPEAMLFELMRVLAPLASGFIESLDKQLGLQGGVVKAGDVRLAAREHALAYIYAFGARDFKRDEYARGLMHRMAVQGMDASLFWRAMAAIDPVLTLSLPESRIGGAARVGETPSPVGGTTRVVETQPIVEKTSQPALHAETGRTAELYERLVLHLSRQDGRDEPAADYAREIAELADAYPETLKRLYRRLQTDELDMDALSLNAGEARQLAVFFAGLAQGNEGIDFQREINARVGKVKDERGFYRHILEKLVCNQSVDFDAAMNEVQRTSDHIARLRILLETSFATGDADELAGQWEALRNDHRELVREVFMRRMGDGKLLKKLAEGFPESMLLELLNILSPQDSGFMAALSGLPKLRGAKNEKNTAFWRYTLGHLHGAQDGDRAEYARGLIRSLSVQGMEQGSLLQALVALAPELRAPLADMQSQPATGARAPAEEPARAEELYRRVAQRLNGDSGEPEFAVLIEEMASAYPEALARLQRQLQSGELRAEVWTLGAREAEQMAVALIRLNAGARENDLFHAVETQAQQARDRQRYYCYILERLIRNETVDLEAALDDAGNEAVQQNVRLDSVCDAAPGQQLSAQPDRNHGGQDSQSDGQEKISRLVAEFATSGRAAELYRRVTRRLSGASGGEPEFSALVEEMANAYPEMLAYLQRQLKSGELRADVGRLDAGEARQLVVSLIRLNSGAKENGFLRAVDAQARQAGDRQRYYRYVLERLIRNEMVDLEAALDDAAPGNDAMPQAERSAPAGDMARDEETSQLQNVAHTSDEVASPARTAWLRTLLDTALSEGNADELVGVWDEIRQRHAGLVRESFLRRMDDENARQRVVQGFPATPLAELVRILAPMESDFVETLATQLQQEQGSTSNAKNTPLWKYTMSYLHATASSGFDRRDYVGGLMNSLSEQGASRADILQAVARADVALGPTLSARQDMHDDTECASAAVTETSATGTERADELFRRVTQRLNGTSRDPEFAAQLEEMASAYPEMLVRLLRQLQAGELRVGTLDARETKAVVMALIRLNSGARESEFLRAVKRHAARAQNEQGYYRFILENLLLDRAIDLEEAASVVAQETARAADDRAEENKVLPGATPGDKQRPQMAEDVRPRATTGDKTMQVENTSAFDEHWSKDAGDSESAEEIYIANAGMVLATPYLPRLFGMLELTEGSKFKDERSAERAIHLLQFMVNESCDSPEFLLSLNKLMCGVPTGVPIVREIELLPREKEAIEGMLNGIIRNWPILGNTSVQGLRESFLQRSGRLQLKEDNWHLKVESKGIDVLLDRLPWSFALIKHPWMRRPIYVEWR